MWALVESGVKFREWVGRSGAVDRWHAPELADWEVPRADPTERRPWKWDVAEQRRVAAQRRRERAKAQRASLASGATAAVGVVNADDARPSARALSR